MTVQEAQEQLATALGVANGRRIPMWAWNRLRVLIGDEETVFLDDSLESPDGKTMSGSVLAFTKNRVILVTISGATASHAGSESDTVMATTWGRGDLREVSVLGGEGSDAAWEDDYEERWGSDRVLVALYEGRDPLSLPLSQGRSRRSEFASFVPQLLHDLRSS